MSSLIVPTPPAFGFRATVLSHGWLELAPFRAEKPYTALERVERLSSGSIVRLVVTSGPGGALHVSSPEAELSDGEREEVTRIVRRIFNLDLDLHSFYDRLSRFERYHWVVESGGGRLLRGSSVWEDMAKTLLTTNTTWAMTCQMVDRLTDLGASDNGARAFPAPETIAALSLTELADHVRAGYRNAYLHRLALDIAEKRLDVESWEHADLPAAELYEQLRSIRGFGPYAAGSMLKLLGRFDKLAIDSAARSMFWREFNGGEKGSDRNIEKHYEHFGEWKGLVIWTDLMRDWFQSQYDTKEAKNGS